MEYIRIASGEHNEPIAIKGNTIIFEEIEIKRGNAREIELKLEFPFINKNGEISFPFKISNFLSLQTIKEKKQKLINIGSNMPPKADELKNCKEMIVKIESKNDFECVIGYYFQK